MLLARSADRVFTPRLSWAKAGTGELRYYHKLCKLPNHLLTHCCVHIGQQPNLLFFTLGDVILRLVGYLGGANKLSLFVKLRPRKGVIADCMRRTRASYHCAVRRV